MDAKGLLRSYSPLIDSHEGTAIPARRAAHTSLAAALVEGHRLGAHEVEVGADAGPSRIGRNHTAGVTKSSFNGQRILLAAANGRAMRRQRRGCPENGHQTAMVIGRHLQRQIGDHEQCIEQIIYAIVLLRRALHKGAAIVLSSYVAHDLVQLYSSKGRRVERLAEELSVVPPLHYSLEFTITFIARQYHGYFGQTLLLEARAGIQGSPLGLQYVLTQTHHLLEGFTRVHAEHQYEQIACQEESNSANQSSGLTRFR